jgi:hypothetical protein
LKISENFKKRMKNSESNLKPSPSLKAAPLRIQTPNPKSKRPSRIYTTGEENEMRPSP